MTDHPKIIFKFREWHNQLHRRIITRREIFLSSPKYFNDPYDCRIPESFYMLDTEEKVDKYFNDLAIRNADYFISLGSYANSQLQFMKDNFKKNKKIYQGELEEMYLKEGDMHFGIFSCSKIWNNIQMWSHYSANHSGFCVGFYREKLYDSLPQCNAASVQYSNEYPKIDPFDTLVQKMFQKSHIKEINWKYEKEYRFYMNSYPDKLSRESRKIIISKDSFESITLGLFFPQNEISIIRRLADNLEVPLYQISKSDQSYNLSRKKLNLI